MAKVMLVEDDNNLRQIYEDRLAAEGHTIVSAKDGEEALALAVKERPDLIIADIMMPKVSGFDMLDILRSTPETKDAKIIMMTALSQAEDKTRAEKLGADKYLVKSQVTLEDVVEITNQMLNEQQNAAAISATGAVTSEPTTVPTPPSTASIPVTVAPTAQAAPEPVTSMPSTTPEPVATPVADDKPTATSISVTAPDEDQDNTKTTEAAPATSPDVDKPEQKTPSVTTISPTPASSLAPAEEEIKGKIDEFIASNPTLSESATPETKKTEDTTPAAPAPVVEAPKSIPVTSPEPEATAASPAGPPKTTPEPAASPNSDQSDKAMAAVDGLLKDSKGSVSVSVESNDPTKPANEYVSDSKSGEGEAQSMIHTKRIEPLTDAVSNAPSINELLAQESDHDAPTPPPVNSVITPGGGSISPLPGSSVQDAISGGGVDDKTSDTDNIAL